MCNLSLASHLLSEGKKYTLIKLLSAHNCNHGTATTRHLTSASSPAAGLFCINWDAGSFPLVTCIASHAVRVRVTSKKKNLIPAICFHHSFNSFTLRTENINSVLEKQSTENLQCRLRKTSDGGR